MPSADICRHSTATVSPPAMRLASCCANTRAASLIHCFLTVGNPSHENSHHGASLGSWTPTIALFLREIFYYLLLREDHLALLLDDSLQLLDVLLQRRQRMLDAVHFCLSQLVNTNQRVA